MKNITLSIDEDVLRQARIYAAENDTTVNAIVREHLVSLKTKARRGERMRGLFRMLDESPLELGPDWKFDRDAIHERGGISGHEHSNLRGPEGLGGRQESGRKKNRRAG